MSVDAGKYKVRVGDRDGEVKAGPGVSPIAVPAVALKPGSIPAVLIGHFMGLRQFLRPRHRRREG